MTHNQLHQSTGLTKSEMLKRGEFRGIRWAKRAETLHLLLLTHENQHCKKRIAIAVPKKTGIAVSRNRMKRLIKEFFRLNKCLFIDHHDNLVRIKKIPQKPTWKDTTGELQRLLKAAIQ